MDEACRLGDGHFAQDAINEPVDTMTKTEFAGKMIIILAGYDNDMSSLLHVNGALSSRFADEIIFLLFDPEDCLRVLETKLHQSQVIFPSLNDTVLLSVGILAVLSVNSEASGPGEIHEIFKHW